MEIIEFRYDNKSYSSLADAIKDAAYHGTVKLIKSKIMPFADELKAENTSLTVDIVRLNDTVKTGLTFQDNISETLKERIINALHS